MSALEYEELYRLRNITENIERYAAHLKEHGFPGSSSPAFVSDRIRKLLKGGTL